MGRPSIHGERKKTYSIKATKTAWDGLKDLAASSGLSLSEYMETLGRTGRLPLCDSTKPTLGERRDESWHAPRPPNKLGG
ncbi:MAG: hypothetical protein F6K56_14730 [Moorea sp. SIO3G5]|nr:hypothetical protein [Moorena sp. SIO3G5]